MTFSIWAPWDSWTAWRRNTRFCTTRVSIPLVACAQISLMLSFSSGRVQGDCWTLCPSDNPRESNHTDLNLDCVVAMWIRTMELLWVTIGQYAMLELGVQEFQDLWSCVRSSSILLEQRCTKSTSPPSQLREEGVEHHGVILPSDIILKHGRPDQALRGNRTPHQDFLGMQSGFVNLTWMLSAPETHVLSVKLLAPELFFFNFSTPVYKMWIIQEPNTLELWNKLHFEYKKRRVYTMFKICSTYICWINI